MSGAMRRCPQTQVRAKRRTLRAGARAKEFSRCPSPFPRAPRRVWLAPHERSNATLPTNSGAREAPHASRRSAREGVQPHARKFVELSDFGTIRSRSANEARPRELTEQARA